MPSPLLPPEAIEALRVSLASFRKPFDAWQVGWHPDTKTFAVYDMDDVRKSSFGDRARVIESGFGDVDDAGRFIATRRAESHLRAALPALYEQWAEELTGKEARAAAAKAIDRCREYWRREEEFVAPDSALARAALEAAVDAVREGSSDAPVA